MTHDTERRGPTVVETLGDVAERWNLQSLREEVDRLQREEAVHVGFLGDFSSGKSTLINELTEMDDLLPVDLEPSTASAGQVVSIPDLEAPEYFRLDLDGSLTPVGRPDFDDLCLGRTAGRPLVRLPSGAGFPAGFVFLDTPGLGSLIEEHAEVTLGELPFLDAAVICVDIRKGGLSRDVTTFLKAPGIRHLQHRFLIALTFADRLPDPEQNEVTAQVARVLAQTIGRKESEAAGRIVVVSAGPQASERDVSALRAAIQEVFEQRRESLMAERRLRSAGRLIPHALSLLQHVRNGLLESDQDFSARKAAEDDKRDRLERELSGARRRLAQAQTAVRQDVQAACNRFHPAFAAASDDQTLQQVSAEFNGAITNVIKEHLTKFGESSVPHVEGLDAELRRVVNDTNRVTNVAATIATAAVAAVLVPGAGAAAGAAGAAGGVAVRHTASKAAATAGAVAVGRTVVGAVEKAGAAEFATGARRVLAAVHRYNPVNMLGDVVAEWWKKRRLEEPMDQLRTQLSNRVARAIEDYYEQEVFQPLERQRDDVQHTLAQIETDRRTDRADRAAKVDRVDADLERLRTASEEQP